MYSPFEHGENATTDSIGNSTSDFFGTPSAYQPFQARRALPERASRMVRVLRNAGDPRRNRETDGLPEATKSP
jgi:hypothetical protein